MADKNKDKEIPEAELLIDKNLTEMKRDSYVDILGTIRKLIIQDKKASNVERLHIAAMAEIAEHLWWIALGVKIGLIMTAIFMFIFLF